MHLRMLPVLLALLFAHTGVCAQTRTTLPQLIPYRNGNLWGYARRGGNLVIPPQFTEAGLFGRRLSEEAFLRLPDTEAYTRVYPTFDRPIAMIRKDSLYGLIDHTGRFIVKPSSIHPLRFFPVDTNLVWVAITVERKYDEEHCEHLTLALLHRSGRLITGFDFNETICEESEYYYGIQDDPYGNRSILDEGYFPPRSQYSDYIVASRDGKVGLLRKDGSIAYPLIWKEISHPRNGMVFTAFSYTNKGDYPISWAVAGPDNRVVKNLPDVSSINTYTRYAPVPARLYHGENCYLKPNGERAFAEKFKTANGFSKNGYAIVQDMYDAWKIIDSTGRKVIDLMGPNSCKPWRDGYYIQLEDGLYYPFDRFFKQTGNKGIPEQNGQVQLPPESVPVVKTPEPDENWREYRRDTLNTFCQIRVYPAAGIRFVTFKGQTAMQDAKGNILIPFDSWHNYLVYPESRVVVIEVLRREGQTVYTVHKVYHLSGAFLIELKSEHVWPLGRHFLKCSNGDKTELRHLPTGKILAQPGQHNFRLIDSAELVKITGFDGQVFGYCDYAGNAYFIH